MRTIRSAAIGVAALFVAAAVAGCTSFGYKATDSPPSVVTDYKTVDVQNRQYTPIPADLTEITMLASLPSPSVPFGADCDRPAGCYSNKQLEDALYAAIANRNLHVDRLRSVRSLSDDAVVPWRPVVMAMVHTTPL